MNKMNKKAAFSLIEALVILLLISVAIMMLIPLITQKTTLPRWISKTKDGVTTLYYGADPSEHVGIGPSVDPYSTAADAISAKLTTNTVAITGNDSTSINFNDNFNYTNSQYNATAPVSQTNSIVIGMNACKNTLTNSTFIKSSTVPIDNANALDCTGSLNIGRKIVSAGNNKLDIKVWKNKAVGKDPYEPEDRGYYRLHNDEAANYISALQLDGNKFTITNPVSETTVLTYDGTTLTSPTLPLKFGAADDAVTSQVILSVLPGNPPHEALDYRNKISENPAGDADDITGGNIRSKEDFNASFGTRAAEYGWWGQSDRRLKNIKSDYVKGIDELSKIKTYNYTYKNDKKKETLAGIIAQELIGIFDEALYKDEKGFYSYDRMPLLYAMVNSVKSLSAKQNDISKKQADMNKKADKLLRMYK